MHIYFNNSKYKILKKNYYEKNLKFLKQIESIVRYLSNQHSNKNNIFNEIIVV